MISKRKGLKGFYLDTNILVDIIRNRDNESVQAFNYIISNSHKCITSLFAYMELFELEKTQRYARKLILENKKDINFIVIEYRKCDLSIEELRSIENDISDSKIFDIIEIQNLSDWNIAKDMVIKTNLSAPDCIHLAIASITSVDYIISKDSDFARKAKIIPIPIIKPDEALKLFI